MPDYGILAGIGEGLKSGVNSYMDMQRFLLEKRREAAAEDQAKALADRQKKELKMQAMSHGLIETPTGDYTYSPEFLQRESQKRKEEFALKGMVADPNAPYGFLRPEELQPPLSQMEKAVKEMQIQQMQSSMEGKKSQLELERERQAAAQNQFQQSLDQKKADAALREKMHRETLAMQKELAGMKKSGPGGAGKQLPANQVVVIAEAVTGLKDMEALPQFIEEHKEKFGPVSGRISGLNPWDEEAQGIQSLIDGLRQTIGKFREGGVLRIEDEKKYAKMLPTLSDTPEVAKEKAIIVARDIKQRVATTRDMWQKSGYDVSGIPGFETSKMGGLIKKQTQQQTPQETPALQTKEYQGHTYIRGSDGLWHRQ